MGVWMGVQMYGQKIGWVGVWLKDWMGVLLDLMGVWLDDWMGVWFEGCMIRAVSHM